MNRKRKSRYLQALERRREEAARQETSETNEPEAEAKPPTRVLVERKPLMFPAKKRRPYWS